MLLFKIILDDKTINRLLLDDSTEKKLYSIIIGEILFLLLNEIFSIADGEVCSFLFVALESAFRERAQFYCDVFSGKSWTFWKPKSFQLNIWLAFFQNCNKVLIWQFVTFMFWGRIAM